MTGLKHRVDVPKYNSEAIGGTKGQEKQENSSSISETFGISTRVLPFPEAVGVSATEAAPPSSVREIGKINMKDKGDLGTVPDSSMVSLFKSLVGFMTEEAQGRGWDDVKARLQAVEAALASRKDAKTGTK